MTDSLRLPHNQQFDQPEGVGLLASETVAPVQTPSVASVTNGPASEKIDQARLRASEYAELKQLIKQRGLLEKQPTYYTIRILTNLALLVVSLTILVTVENFALQLLNAVFLAFVFVQLAFLGHNSGHRQVGMNAEQDDMITILHMGFLLGASPSWWVDKHNEHHGNPNVLDLDPDIDIPIMAFSEEQFEGKPGWVLSLMAYQAYIFPFVTTIVPYNMRYHSLLKIWRGESRHPIVEILGMTTHFALFLGLLFSVLPTGQAIAFFLLNQACAGIYFSSVFAVNHKGMPVMDQDNDLGFVRLQILTSRNIYGHPLTDFFYGGLNYQIEHHLFPSMPQNKLREAQVIVKEFCRERNIPYYETSFYQGLKEVLMHLHEVSAPLRAPRPPAPAVEAPHS